MVARRTRRLEMLLKHLESSMYVAAITLICIAYVQCLYTVMVGPIA